MADRNRVVTGTATPSALWLVVAEWRGGHDKQVFSVQNIHTDEKAARADWERLTPENHNVQHGYPADYDAGFKCHPLRCFKEDA